MFHDYSFVVILHSCNLNGKLYFPKGRSEPLLPEEERKKLEKEFNLDGASESPDSYPQGDSETIFDEL
jgi:hypothetical protein